MRILITGNMGYVGPVVTEHLRVSIPDATLIGVDTCYFGQCLIGSMPFPESRLNAQYFADLRNLDPALLQGVDAVIMLAAISNDPMGNAFEAVTDEINRRACVRLARAAKKAGVGHVVFASSCSVYGFAEGRARDENSEVNPLTAYARSKIATEREIAQLANDEFLITSLRFPTACGFSPRLRFDLVLNDLVASALVTGKIEVLSDGTPWRPLIDVRDMALAMEWAIRRPMQQRPFVAVNVGRNDCNYQVKDLAEAVAELIPGTSISINTDALPDKRSYEVNFDLYRELAADFLPKRTLQDSIISLRAGLEACGFADPKFRESDFVRLRVLSGFRRQGLLDESLYWVRQ
jgi:nucleoside-diphosphate-sugar epimerase